jgi:hypothetical protein
VAEVPEMLSSDELDELVRGVDQWGFRWLDKIEFAQLVAQARRALVSEQAECSREARLLAAVAEAKEDVENGHYRLAIKVLDAAGDGACRGGAPAGGPVAALRSVRVEIARQRELLLACRGPGGSVADFELEKMDKFIEKALVPFASVGTGEPAPGGKVVPRGVPVIVNGRPRTFPRPQIDRRDVLEAAGLSPESAAMVSYESCGHGGILMPSQTMSAAPGTAFMVTETSKGDAGDPTN